MSDYSRCPFAGEVFAPRNVSEVLDVLAEIVEGPAMVACDRCDFACLEGELEARPHGIGRRVCGECLEELRAEVDEDAPDERRRSLCVVGYSGF